MKLLAIRRSLLFMYNALDALVRARCFQNIITEKCLTEILIREVSLKIVRCQCQMMTFNFFLALCLRQTLFNLRENLSKSLQSKIISAASGHRLTYLTRCKLGNMRSDENIQNYYRTIVKKAAEYPHIE